MKWWPRSRDERDLERELQSHLESEIAEQRDSGLNPAEAGYAARRAFGNVGRVREETRAAWGWTAVEQLAQDFRYACRSVRKAPGFTLVAVLSLSLGIGANTAIFTFVNAALLRPLPYPAADRILVLSERMPNGALALVHPRSFLAWRDNARSLEALAIAEPVPVNTDGADAPEQISSLWSTSEIFRVFGVTPALGREFAPGERDVVVLSDGYWRRRFGADPDILGRSIRMDSGSSVVIGVMPRSFRAGASDPDVYTPLIVDRAKPDAVGSRSFLCFGRLRRGVSLETARAEIGVLESQLVRQNPSDAGWSSLVDGLRDFLVRGSRPALLLLLAVVGLVLLIACANMAGLLLTRGLGRRAEFALRASLGASRFRLLRQLLVESLVLSGLGGGMGLLLGAFASRVLALLARDAVAFGQLDDVHLDLRVLVFTLALSILTAVVFGLAPAWTCSRFDLQSAVKHRGGSSGERGQQRFRSLLVAGELAFAVVLLAGAGLLIRTFSQLLAVPLGFRPEHVLTVRMFVTGEPARRAHLVDSILDRVETIPGVSAAGTVQFLPLGGWTNRGPFHFAAQAEEPRDSNVSIDTAVVSRGYFAAMGVAMVRGRPFGREDRMGAKRVALVNQTFVKRYSPNRDPIGLSLVGDWSVREPAEITGIVADIRHDGLTEEPRPTAYLCQSQAPGYFTYLVARSPLEPSELAVALRHAVHQVDPQQALPAVVPMRHYLESALARPRLFASLTGAFAALALALAAIGLYGLMAYAVSRRTHEIGIRVALGAAPAALLRWALLDGLRLAGLGSGTGVLAAIGAGRLVSGFLYGVSSNDLATYAGVAALLGVVALLAVWIPARRASRVDPMVALRHE